MGCAIDQVPETRQSDVMLDWAEIKEHDGKPLQAAWYRAKAAQILNEEGQWISRPGKAPYLGVNKVYPAHQIFMCGPGIVPCGCGQPSDYLCDYPAGKNQTCDAALCEDCHTRHKKGRRVWDYCPQHEALMETKQPAEAPY